MQIVDAVWEQRNLGVSCIEITVEDEDTVESIKKQVSEHQTQYMVVKVPPCRTDVMFALTEINFSFIECVFHATHDLKTYEVKGIQKRLTDAVQYKFMDDNDLNLLFTEIKDGMFTTDRVSVDPNFGPIQAANRYVGWIRDELDRGSEVYKLIYKDDPIGFFAFKEIGDGIYHSFLAGMYKKGINTGLGINIIYKPICETVKRKGKMISVSISSNNLNALNVHTLLNFRFKDMSYVYVRHC